jgi:hypothetical protein
MAELGRKLKLAARKASGQDKPFSSGSSSELFRSTSVGNVTTSTTTSGAKAVPLTQSDGSKAASSAHIFRANSGSAAGGSAPEVPPKPSKVAFERPSSSPTSISSAATSSPSSSSSSSSSITDSATFNNRVRTLDDSNGSKGWKVSPAVASRSGASSASPSRSVLGQGRTSPDDASCAPSSSVAASKSATSIASPLPSAPTSVDAILSPKAIPKKPLPAVPTPLVADIKVGPLQRLSVSKDQQREKWRPEWAALDKHYLRFYADEVCCFVLASCAACSSVP